MRKRSSYLARAIQAAVAGHSAQNDRYNLYGVNDGKSLDFAAERGLPGLYRRVFAEPPYNEDFTDDQVYQEFRDTLKAAAVTRGGGRVISNVFQKVASTRQGGEVMQDRRAFYLFTPEQDADSDYLQRVTILRPGGNDTAIVWDNIPRRQQADIAASIQKSYPGVEQVMFMEKNPATGRIRGQMAGGEFCGNATRSLGYLLMDGKDGRIDLDVSGTDRTMSVTVNNGQALAEIPVKPDLGSVSTLASGEMIVQLDGIAHLVTRTGQPSATRLQALGDIDERKAEVKRILQEVGLVDNPASGVMVVREQPGGKLTLDPYVYVRDTGTLYYESACGSGSTAVGMVQAVAAGGSVEGLEISQPSGMTLNVQIKRDEKEFQQAFVNGPVEIMFDARMYLPRKVIERKQALSL